MNEKTYKIVNVTNGAVIAENLDFYDARYRMGDSLDMTMMENDADVAEKLNHRALLIEAQERYND